jgi:hypothetical protein
MDLKNKLIVIDEGDKFFQFMEDMVSKGQKTGKLKLKDGTSHSFRYVLNETVNDKKRYYIQVI